MLQSGFGVSQDYFQAYKWLTLAIANLPASDVKNRARTTQCRDSIVDQLTREQIAEAQNLARDWRPKLENRDYWELKF
jgi:hypothetical protein